MKYFSSLILFILTLSFVSCSQVQPLVKNKMKSQNSIIVSVFMYDDSKYKNSYRIYVNHKDLNTTLTPNGETIFTVKPGQTTIQIVKNRETASIDLVTLNECVYKLRVFTDERGHIELLQVSKRYNNKDNKK